MTSLLFALLGQVCIVGLIASCVRPQWFRMGGRVPKRRKIGGIWLALALVCAVGALLGSGSLPAGPAFEAVNATRVEPAVTDVPIDIALPRPAAADELQDASKDAAPDPVTDIAGRAPGRR